MSLFRWGVILRDQFQGNAWQRWVKEIDLLPIRAHYLLAFVFMSEYSYYPLCSP